MKGEWFGENEKVVAKMKKCDRKAYLYHKKAHLNLKSRVIKKSEGLIEKFVSFIKESHTKIEKCL